MGRRGPGAKNSTHLLMFGSSHLPIPETFHSELFARCTVVDRGGRQFPSIPDLMNEVRSRPTKIISKKRTVTRHQSVMQSRKRISTVSLNDSF